MMSKKLIYVRIVIGIICFIFIGSFIFLIRNIQKSITVEDKIVEETIEEKIIFDLSKPPREQRKKIYGNRKEYLRQLYNDIFKDYKFSNCIELFSYGQLVDNFKSVNSLKKLIIGMKYKSIFKILFMYDDKDIYEDLLITYPLNLDDIPVTEKYKEKHPKPLFEEFNFIKKENYRTKDYYDKYNEYNYWYEFDYSYGIGVDEETKTICVGEKKSASKLYIENGIEKSGIVYNKEGNEVSAYVETRDFYFTYTTDEKGYVDDIVYDRTETIIADKYLDNSIRY